jgi:hypothetical protein
MTSKARSDGGFFCFGLRLPMAADIYSVLLEPKHRVS